MTKIRPFGAVLEPEMVLELFAAALSVAEEPLPDVARRSPLAAYGILRTYFLMCADEADEDAGCGHAARRKALEERMPMPPTETMRITLSMWDVPDSPESEPRTMDRVVHEILSFTVEPPTDLFS
ncbi:MAG TPA: hypothetical protein VLH84_04175 [Patescibacteria group bacterium]|nr:hypothetical protein [Patescibacteria group bacterium]